MRLDYRLRCFNWKIVIKLAVIEMGMSGAWRNKTIGKYSKTEHFFFFKFLFITTIGISHIEKLGSRQNIAKAKLEILEPLGKDDLSCFECRKPS